MSDHVVVDCSVVAKWFLPEEAAAAAAELLHDIRTGSVQAHAPDLIFAELPGVLWKHVRRRQLEARDALDILALFQAAPLDVTPVRPLSGAALGIALETGCTVYDAVYVALAMRVEGRVVTADTALVRKLAGTPYETAVSLL